MIVRMAATTTRKRKSLPALPPETWGWRMKRARVVYADMSLGEVIDKLGRYKILDAASISRLEMAEEAPTARRQRETAYLLALIYGLDPGQFGVGPDDLPPGLREQVNPSTRWYAGTLRVA